MTSLWLENENLPKFDSLCEDIDTDVLIIGGGLSGILCAFMLSSRGVDCTIAEASRIMHSTSGHTTAKISAQHGLIYDRLIQTFGKTAARLYYDAASTALSAYATLCKDIDCSFERRDSYIFTQNDRAAAEREADALDALGIEHALHSTLPLPLKIERAVSMPNQAQFNPVQFAAHIARGLRIFEHTRVQSVKGRTAYANGHRIKAQKIIVTTHFPIINKFGGYFLKLYQHRSYVLALEKAPLPDGIFLEAGGDALSFRTSGDKLLLGGFGHRTGEACRLEALRSCARRLYPGAHIALEWSAQDCMSLDAVPYIGRYSAFAPDIYTATGFNKWGMTGAMCSAAVLCDMLLSGENEYRALYSPSRSIFHAQLLENIMSALKNLLARSERRCTHMGCALKWNSQQQTWDCPCHGSRYDSRGEIVNSPAVQKLKMRNPLS